ncbi:unnamed protein product [Rotaria socialis]|uniref:Uncharacterized protein n=2 Tax=Rotaria socialis TaxID=392032 RepID=A0A818P393_9BILA|nr:unnamed protein product [Rotaria socialis]CAF3614589.1 unnamed protein product [Rotaria socialis]CAF4511560.1 unnamed protein product [Rotaria socialis]CAF4868625.1 unnamed protein product [Rotaria socialis]CAF4876028.1 unnamed protein product [Rotaria socialis]
MFHDLLLVWLRAFQKFITTSRQNSGVSSSTIHRFGKFVIIFSLLPIIPNLPSTIVIRRKYFYRRKCLPAKESNQNQSKDRHECTDNFDQESNGSNDELENDSEESDVPNYIQDSSEDPDGDAATEQDSGVESETSDAVTESTSQTLDTE